MSLCNASVLFITFFETLRNGAKKFVAGLPLQERDIGLIQYLKSGHAEVFSKNVFPDNFAKFSKKHFLKEP